MLNGRGGKNKGATNDAVNTTLQIELGKKRKPEQRERGNTWNNVGPRGCIREQKKGGRGRRRDSGGGTGTTQKKKGMGRRENLRGNKNSDGDRTGDQSKRKGQKLGGGGGGEEGKNHT